VSGGGEAGKGGDVQDRVYGVDGQSVYAQSMASRGVGERENYRRKHGEGQNSWNGRESCWQGWRAYHRRSACEHCAPWPASMNSRVTCGRRGTRQVKECECRLESGVAAAVSGGRGVVGEVWRRLAAGGAGGVE
jgi:hypothetical protein